MIVLGRKSKTMTRFIDRPDAMNREARVRIPQGVPAPLFQGWGPKF
jgi:hypothetical protein